MAIFDWVEPFETLALKIVVEWGFFTSCFSGVIKMLGDVVFPITQKIT